MQQKQMDSKRRVEIDPVCGMRVDRQRSRFSWTDRRQTTYFCSMACMAEFSRHRGEYLAFDARPKTVPQETVPQA